MHNAQKRLKHSKYRNSGLIFEMLIRQISLDVFNHKKDSKARNILEKYYSKGHLLHDEYRLYSAIMNSRNKSKDYIDSVIKECRSKVKNISSRKLSHEKYELVKEITDTFGEDFFKSNLPDYKIFASIYKLFTIGENNNLRLNIGEEARLNEFLVESLSDNFKVEDLMLEARTDDEIIDDALVFRILVEKFNKKYAPLSENQRNILSLYVNNSASDSDFRKILLSEISDLNSVISLASTNITDEALKIKVKHVANLIPRLINKINNNIISEDIISQVLLYSELINEISE